MKDIHLWEFIRSNISKTGSVMLVTVVDHRRGSPGKRGFKMAISLSADYIGSVGGGIMEYRIISESANALSTGKAENQIAKLFHNRTSRGRQSGLICSGSQTNLSIILRRKDLKIVEKIISALKKRTEGRIFFTTQGISFDKNESALRNVVRRKTEAGAEPVYAERIGPEDRLIVAGCGHVGLAVCRIFAELDFHVTAIDDRKDLKIAAENIFADKVIIDSYSHLGKYIRGSDNEYVVIVTTGFRSDKEALMQVTGRNVGYIGLMGTRSKIKKIFSEAVSEGADRKALKKIHAPVGIDIGSDTPEEIAVSIAAEIIKIRNSRRHRIA